MVQQINCLALSIRDFPAALLRSITVLSGRCLYRALKSRCRLTDAQTTDAQQPWQILKLMLKFLSELFSACRRRPELVSLGCPRVAARCLAGAPPLFSSIWPRFSIFSSIWPRFSIALLLFSSIRVENLTVPSSEISTCGVVPRMPMVATGVSIFISPVFATLPAMNVNVPLDRLKNVDFGLPFGL